MIRKKIVEEKPSRNPSWQQPSVTENIPRRTLENNMPDRDVSALERKQILPGSKILHTVNNGEIIVKTNEAKCKGCDHARHSHYGSLNHQCNTRECECEAFR